MVLTAASAYGHFPVFFCNLLSGFFFQKQIAVPSRLKASRLLSVASWQDGCRWMQNRKSCDPAVLQINTVPNITGCDSLVSRCNFIVFRWWFLWVFIHTPSYCFGFNCEKKQNKNKCNLNPFIYECKWTSLSVFFPTISCLKMWLLFKLAISLSVIHYTCNEICDYHFEYQPPPPVPSSPVHPHTHRRARWRSVLKERFAIFFLFCFCFSCFSKDQNRSAYDPCISSFQTTVQGWTPSWWACSQ